MNDRIYQPPRYPLIGLLVRIGGFLAVIIGLAILGGGAYLAVNGMGVNALVVAVPMALLAYVIFTSYIEMLRIVSDTLMPR